MDDYPKKPKGYAVATAPMKYALTTAIAAAPPAIARWPLNGLLRNGGFSCAQGNRRRPIWLGHMADIGGMVAETEISPESCPSWELRDVWFRPISAQSVHFMYVLRILTDSIKSRIPSIKSRKGSGLATPEPYRKWMFHLCYGHYSPGFGR